MNKKHKLITILLCIALCVSLVFSLIACDTDKEKEKTPTDSGKVIANGNFELTSSADFPKTPTSWKGAAGSTATDNSTETDVKNLVSGVIDVEKTAYDKNKRQWDKLPNPGKSSLVEGDSNILMIYNKKNNSYRYTSNDFSLDSNKFYKVSVDVRTDEIEGSGAYVGIGGDTFKLIPVGDTKGQWTTIEFFLQTSNLENNSINVVVTNGMKGKNDGKLSKGYTFIDNVIVAESTAEIYKATAETATVKKSSLILSDNNFENVSLTGSAPYTPNKWDAQSSKDAPTGTDYIEKGILDLNETRPEYVPADLQPNGADSKVLFLNNKQRTAYGYRSNKRIRFESSKYYKLTINVATFINLADLGANATPNADNTGAFLRLKTGSGVDDVVKSSEILGINTNGAWGAVTFYIQADTKRNKDYYIELGLGTGGKDDVTTVAGKAFFDNISLEAVEESVYTAITDAEDTANNLIKKVSFDTGNITNSIAEANTRTDFYSRDEVAYLDSHITDRGNDIVYRDLATWDEATMGANPKAPNSAIASVMELTNKQPTANIYKFASNLKIAPNGYYRMSAWIKTKDILDTKGVNVSLYSYDAKKASETPDTLEKDLVSKLVSFDNINTANIKNHVTASYNDYVELVFFVEGDLLLDKEVFLQVALGSGNFLDSSKHAKGSCYLADLSFYAVDYTDYNAESGTYIKKHSFKSSVSTLQNGDFNDINTQATLKAYPKESDMSKLFGLPSSWTYSDESYLRSSVNAGIINNKSTDLLNKLNESLAVDKQITMDNAFYNGFDKEFGSGIINTESNRNLLVINSKKASEEYAITEPTRPSVCGCTCPVCIANGYCDGTKCTGDCKCAHHGYNGKVKPWGFTSPSMSLSADSYYMISVWAYAVDGTATVALKTNSKDQTKNFNITADTNSKWKRYDFYVETGFDSTSANLELFLGDKNVTESLYQGTVFFDMPRYIKVSEEIFDQAQKDKTQDVNNIELASYTVTTFDNVTSNPDALDSPVGYSGAHRDEEAPKEEKDTINGVYNIDHSNRNWLGKDDATRIPLDVLNQIYGKDNTNTLVINNNVATEYSFTNKLSRTLPQNSYYLFSIDVLTYKLAKEATANITLKLEGTSYSFSKDAEKKVMMNTSTYADDGTETIGGWRTYYFYIKTPTTMSVDNVALTLALGNKGKDNYVSGYAFFDNINITKINDTDFPEKVKPETVAPEDEHKYDNSITHRIEFTEEDAKKEEPTDEKKSDPLLWLYITSGVIGGLLVLAVIVVMFRKFYKPKKKIRGVKKGNESYSRNKVDVNKSTAPTSPEKSKKSDKFKD